MKNHFTVFLFLCIGSAAFAQSGSAQILRDNFHANDVAVQPDASQITNETPINLVRANGAAVMPAAEQISTATPTGFPKAAPGTMAVQPDASQISYATPPQLLKTNKITASPQPVTAQPR